MATVADRHLTPQTLLAFDFGTRRIGVASGNALARLATPRATITAQGDARWAAIERLVREWQPDALVVGIPCHPDGEPHAMTQHAERFARQLEGRLRLPVTRVDERYSSVEADSRDDGPRGDEGSLDARSAVVILEQYFSEQGRAS